MDGLLIVDKPVGPTSHDVVARIRRALGIRRVGHTGTLDPAASGLMAVVLGRATRLARFLSEADKTYDAVVRLGIQTDTCDAQGQPVGEPYQGPFPSAETIDLALNGFRGTIRQQPPAYSAKKIGGRPSYAIARAEARRAAVQGGSPASSTTRPVPVTVTAHSIDLLEVNGNLVTLRVRCSAGFYMRALAHDLGEHLGTGGHLAALRRVRSGEFTVEDAIGLDQIERAPGEAIQKAIPVSRMLPGMDSVVLTRDGVRRAAHGVDLGPGDIAEAGDRPSPPSGQTARAVRLLDGAGDLIAVAGPGRAPGLLHPLVVLM